MNEETRVLAKLLAACAELKHVRLVVKPPRNAGACDGQVLDVINAYDRFCAFVDEHKESR